MNSLKKNMGSEEELDTVVLDVIYFKIKRKRKRKIWSQDIYKTHECFGSQYLLREMKLINRETYYE